MTKNKNKGKAILAGLALFASAIPTSSQERLEIQVTETNGVSRTIEVDRNILELDLSVSELTSITLPAGLMNLRALSLHNNWLTSLDLPEGLTNLERLSLGYNQLTNLILPEGLTNLRELYLHQNQLTNFTLSEGLPSLGDLSLNGNQLTNLVLPEGLVNLEHLWLHSNELTSLTLPKGLTILHLLVLNDNQQLTSLTLAEDTAERFAGIDADKTLAYNLGVYCYNVPLKEVILPKRLDGKISFFEIEDDVYNNLEFLFLEDLRSPRITRAGDALEITWAVGVLQTSASIEGPWKDVRASSPLRIFPRPSLPAEFFRGRSKEQ